MSQNDAKLGNSFKHKGSQQGIEYTHTHYGGGSREKFINPKKIPGLTHHTSVHGMSNSHITSSTPSVVLQEGHIKQANEIKTSSQKNFGPKLASGNLSPDGTESRKSRT